MNIKITSDSTCDLSAELLERYSISLVPLYVVMDGRSCRDGVDIFPADIFAHVAAGGALCTTSAVSGYDYEQHFSKYSGSYDAVIHITIGSCFSSCYQNACGAAKAFPNVYVVDSANLSTGQGLVVLSAARMALQGLPAEEIVRRLNELTPRVEASFLLDRLDYMRKGGRCSAVTALGANLLKLKPCIEVKDGRMSVGKKYRGTFEKCIRQYAEERLKGREDLQKDMVFITHTPTAENVVRAVKEAVAVSADFAETFETSAGCTISCHCGPSTLGVLFIRK